MPTVNLVSYTQTAPNFAHAEEVKDIQDLVAFCARVSNPGNQLNSETAPKLIKYLIKNKHWSPFEMVNVCLEIVTTRDIGRQLLRHRSFSFQEFSQRYAVVGDAQSGLEYSIRECRLQDEKNRQNSVPINKDDIEQAYLAHQWEKKQKELIGYCDELYKWALDNNIAKEQARSVLPEGLTNSRMYVNGTLRSWIHYIEVRAGNGTQKEHMLIAQECAKVIAKIFPTISEMNIEQS